jgi:hypothetical protein
MSIPIAQIRYAGTWNAINTYSYASLVLSPIDNELYVWPYYNSISGGSDPSVISSGWVLLPTNTGGGTITGVTAGTGLSGGGSAGVVTLNNDGVLQLNTQSGSLTLTSANTNLVVGSSGSGNIELNVPTGAGGISSLNTLTGDLTIAAGTGISVTPSGTNITIASTSGGNVLGKYGETITALALTGSYAVMASQTFTTTTASAPLLVWATLNILDGGSGSVISAKLVVNGTNKIAQQMNITNGHYQTITLLASGTGPVIPGTFNVVVQALVSSGSATRQFCSIITNAQFTLSP